MKTTNLIQSYVSSHPASQQYHSDKAVREFDVHKELSNRTFIKPLPSNGKLVRKSLLDLPSEFRKDVHYDWKAFKHAVKGDANDHELGRLNDVGMKLGGLAIAAYLFTRKQTPMTKVFEFIGLGTFFAAMDFWPKLFIQLPAKLIHGVNVRQEYEDSFGRKKMFYQDHQFIPWDLYSDDEINKIGDRLNVPKDIPNRREFIQEKMRKIALQNNTLWMLTAGVATPLMSALMCNALEKPMAAYLDQRTTKKANDLMTNFTQEISKFDFTENIKALDEILTANSGKAVTPEIVDAIHHNLSQGLDYMLSEGLRRDLDRMLLGDGKFRLTDSNIEGIQGALKSTFETVALSEDELARIIPNADSIKQALSAKSLLGGAYDDFSEHTKIIQDLLDNNVREFLRTNPNHPAARKLNFLAKQLVHSAEHGADSPLVQSLKTTSANILDENIIKILRTLANENNSFKAKTFILDKFAYMKAGQAPETSLANGWNEAESIIFKAMNFTPEEIKKARLDGEIASEVLRSKLESITADKTAYSKFVSEIERALSSIQGRVKSLDMTQDANTNLYKSRVISTYDGYGEVLRQLGFESFRENLVGFPGIAKTSSKEIAFDFVADRVKGVKSSFYRFLNLADMYYRISHSEDVTQLLKGYPREVKEELVELAKITLLEGHNSDFAVKFWQRRNPSPNMDDYSDIVVQGGKVINKYFGKHKEGEIVELANDNGFYQSVMKLMFGGEPHIDTRTRIQDSILSEFQNYRRQALEVFGGDKYFVKPSFLVDGKQVSTSSWSKFLLMGSSPNEMFFKRANQSFNSGKWFSLFGKLGAALAGVTLLAQFFFGRMKDPQKDQEVKA